MSFNGNKLQLYSYHLQILGDRGTVRYLANKTKYDAFHRRNQPRLNALLKEISDMQEEYFVVENNEVKTKTNLVRKLFRLKALPVMKPGKTEKQFNIAFNKLMEEPVVINA